MAVSVSIPASTVTTISLFDLMNYILMKKIIYILICLTLLMGACTDDSIKVDSGVFHNSEMVDVTVQVSVDDELRQGTRSFGDGNSIDMLVYSVYDENGIVLSQYGKGLDDPEKKFNYDNDGNVINPALKDIDIAADHDQTIKYIGNAFNNEGGKVDITLRVMRGTKFNLSIWAQSSQCDAYDFTDLTKVEVDYSKIKINNDTYDAFCASTDFSVGKVETDLKVTLYRPFAQINVGVKSNLDGTPAINYEEYSYAALKFTGIAKYMDVTKNAILNDDINEERSFSWAKIPKTANTFNVDEYTADGELQKNNSYDYVAMCYVLVPDGSYEKDKDGNYLEGETVKDTNVNGSEVTDSEGNESNDNDNDEENKGVIYPQIKGTKITKFSILLAKEVSESNGEVTVTEQKISRYEDIPVHRNWRTNILFLSDKPLGPPDKPDELKTPEFVNVDPESIYRKVTGDWNPLKEYYDIYIEPIDDKDTDFYKYVVKLGEIDLTSSITEHEGKKVYKCSIPTNLIESLIKKESKIQVKAISTNKNFYISDNSEFLEMPVEVNWDTDKKWIWNFSGNDDDNLGGKNFVTEILGYSDDGSDFNLTEKSYGNSTAESYYLTLLRGESSVTVNKSRIRFGGGGSQTGRNLNFNLHFPCKVTITRTDQGTGENYENRFLIVDYEGKTYNEEPDLGKFKQSSDNSEKTKTHYIRDFREGGTIYLYSSSSGIGIEKIVLEFDNGSEELP